MHSTPRRASSPAPTSGDATRNPVENDAVYPIFGITNASPTDGFNPAALDRSFRFRVWDADTVNGWVDIAAPLGLTFDAFHNLSVAFDGTNLTYKLDGATLYTDTTASDAGFGDLQTAFVEAYNFGDGNYSVRWDNISATSVPEPASAGPRRSGGRWSCRHATPPQVTPG